jgi:hypothetical protein
MAAIIPPALAEVVAAFTVCGITAPLATTIIASQGFTSMEDFNDLEDDDEVENLASRLAKRPSNNGRVLLGHGQIKNVQALAWWVRDCAKQNLPVDGFDLASLNNAKARKRAESERTTVPTLNATDLEKSKASEFDIHKDAFLNLLSQHRGSSGEPLRYVVRDVTPPAVFANNKERHRYALNLAGPAFDRDNRAVYHMLKSYLINTDGWTWISGFDTTENGRGTYLAWAGHYNGEGEFNKRAELVEQQVQHLRYKNERAFSFDKYIAALSKAFMTLNKKPHMSKTPYQQVKILLEGIKMNDPEIKTIKTLVHDRYQEMGEFQLACNCLSEEITFIYHGGNTNTGDEGAGTGRKCYISTTDNDRSRGHGRFGGRGGRGRG